MLLDAANRLKKNDLETIVGSVFSTTMALDVEVSDAPCPGPAGLLTAAVYLTGEWQGAICLHCHPLQACDFAGRFMAMPPRDAVDDDVRDVMGELANMIAGDLKCTFCPGIRVSIPSVTDGIGCSLRVCRGHVTCQAAFHSDGGPFWITLIDSVKTESDSTNARAFPAGR